MGRGGGKHGGYDKTDGTGKGNRGGRKENTGFHEELQFKQKGADIDFTDDTTQEESKT